MATFRGFSDRAVGFYSALGADNSKTFWAEHKAVYEDEVREPMRNLLAELEPEFGAGTVFRPHRDTRFSKDKAPYKTHQGAIAGSSAGIGFYVQLDSRGLLVGGGFRAHSTAQVERYRKAVDCDDTGAALGAVVAAVRDNGFAIEGDQLKTNQRGTTPTTRASTCFATSRSWRPRRLVDPPGWPAHARWRKCARAGAP